MSTTYHSKIDIWLIAVISIVLLAPIALTRELSVSIGPMIIFVWVMAKCFTTRYVINGDNLEVRVLFVKQTFNIHCIRSISKTHSILSSQAWSLDRLRISVALTPQARFTDDLIISPRRKKEFIDELLKINPEIKTDLQL